MLTAAPQIRRLFLSPLFHVLICALAVLSYAIGDRFTAGEFAPWLVFPALVLLFFVLSPQAWLRAGFYAAAGLIAAHVVMALLGFERHGMMSQAGHHSTTVILHILFEVSVDIALAVGFVLMLKRIAPHTYEGGIIATYDVEQVLNWRLVAALMALPFYVFAVRFIEAALAGVIFGMSFEAWPVLGADLVGYFMFLPLIVGIILALTGAPRLEPDYQPLNVLVVGYIALVGILTELGVLFGSQVSSPLIIAPFAVASILVLVLPTLHVAGRLLLVNYAGFIIASKYAGLEIIDSFVVIISVSICIALIMLLRVIAQVKMNRANARTEVYLRAGTGAFAIVSEDQEFVFVSEQFLNMLEYEKRDDLPSPNDLVPSMTRQERQSIYQKLKNYKTGELIDLDRIDTLLTRSGKELKVTRQLRWFEVPGVEGRLLSVNYQDVTSLQEALRLATNFLDSHPTVFCIQNEDYSWHYISDAFKQFFEVDSMQELNAPTEGLWVNRSSEQTLKRRAILSNAKTGDVIDGDELYILERSNGELVYFNAKLRWIDNPNGEGRLLLTSFENITELLLRQEEIEAQKAQLQIQAFTDPLTEVWNRSGLNAKLKLNERAQDHDLAIYLLDVDFFKSVNDIYSHRVGDDLLIAVAQTLKSVSPENAIVARLGGQEFLVATPWIDAETAKNFGGTLRRAIGETQIQSESNTVSRTTSVGIAKLSRTEKLDTALSLADLALSEAKARGRNLDILANETFRAEMEARGAFITETEIEAGLLAHELKFFVQPIYNTERKEVEGFETLIRWIKPNGSVIPPNMFLRQFNKVFLKKELRDVGAQMRFDLLDNLRCYPGAYVSWNYELDQFLCDDFTNEVITQAKEAIEKYGTQLVVEISERAINIRLDMASIERNLQRIRYAGILIALDDFGTDQSNINRLMRLPIDIIKFDKSLIDNAAHNTRVQATIAALGKLAQGLEIKVIAEGVETAAQAEFLHEVGLYSQQGYLHAKPMDPKILATQDVTLGLMKKW